MFKKNGFCQLTNVHRVSGVRQTEKHTAESAVSEPRACKAEMAIEKLKRFKLPSTVEVP